MSDRYRTTIAVPCTSWTGEYCPHRNVYIHGAPRNEFTAEITLWKQYRNDIGMILKKKKKTFIAHDIMLCAPTVRAHRDVCTRVGIGRDTKHA
jgi:hypothetical protein